MADFGLRVIIAPSFADIFYGNALNNGLLPIQLSESQVSQLMQEVIAQEGAQIAVDLQALLVRSPMGTLMGFTMNESARQNLLQGLDAIGLTLAKQDEIVAYEQQLPYWRV